MAGNASTWGKEEGEEFSIPTARIFCKIEFLLFS